MGNMSYCRFHNTTLDFADCDEALGRAFDPTKDFEEISSDPSLNEQEYAGALVEQAAELLGKVQEELAIDDEDMMDLMRGERVDGYGPARTLKELVIWKLQQTELEHADLQQIEEASVRTEA